MVVDPVVPIFRHEGSFPLHRDHFRRDVGFFEVLLLPGSVTVDQTAQMLGPELIRLCHQGLRRDDGTGSEGRARCLADFHGISTVDDRFLRNMVVPYFSRDN